MAKYGFGPQTQEKTSGIDLLLFGSNWVQKRVAELGLEIFQDYADDQPVLVGVLKGGSVLHGRPYSPDPLPFSLEFISISNFGNDGVDGVKITNERSGQPYHGKDILVVEDVVGTEVTLNHLATRKPTSLEVCTLLDKRVCRLVDVPIKYVGTRCRTSF